MRVSRRCGAPRCSRQVLRASGADHVLLVTAATDLVDLSARLGLMHTNDVTTLMDTTGADETLLVDQSFGIADVVDFPIGRQNAPLLLEETVGRAVAKTHSFPDDGLWRCGTCGASLSLINGSTAETSN